MAMNYKYNRVTTEKFSIKGELSADGKTIDYVNSEKEAATISLVKCFEKFAGKPIELSIALKTDEDLSEEFEEE